MMRHVRTLMVAAAVLVPAQAVLAQAGNERLLWVDGQAGRLRVSDGGSGGTPVLFVHSLAGNLRQWSNQLAHLRSNRRAVAFDLRGHGESDKPSGADYSLEGVAADIDAVANQLGLDRFVLVGHSFGGGAVATYAGAHPERVAGLFLVDPIGDQRSARTQVDILVQMLQSPAYQSAAMMYYEAILVNATPDVRGQVLAALGQTSQEALVKAFASIVEFDPAATLQPYSGPMFNIISDLNEFPTSLHNIIPNLPTERIVGTSHWLHMDRPEEFNSHLDGFLAGKH
jgi:pimeloyl-ACP methyl ester carboxylesterase